MNIILHIGSIKTGTTFLQRSLFSNRSVLSKNFGILYPKLEESYNHRSLLLATGYGLYDESQIKFTDIHKKLKINSLSSLQKGLTEIGSQLRSQIYAGRPHTVILSSEHLHSRIVKINQIIALRNFLTDYFSPSNIKIILYIRRQDLLVVSRFATFLRSGHCNFNYPNLDFPEFKDSLLYNYYNLISCWSEVFGYQNIYPKIYEKENLFEGDLLKDFLSCCRCYSKEIIQELQLNKKEINTALTYYGMCLLYSYNIFKMVSSSVSQGSKHDGRSQNITPVEDNLSGSRFLSGLKLSDSQKNFASYPRKFMIDFLEKFYPGKERLISGEDAKAFLENFNPINLKTKERFFFTTMNSNKYLFNNDFSMYENRRKPLQVLPIEKPLLNQLKSHLTIQSGK